MRYAYNDGGRAAAGFKGEAPGDCVTRAIAIATGLPYAEAYAGLNALARSERTRRGKVGFLAATGRGSSARTGVLRVTYDSYLASLGWRWVPCMAIGKGCTVHLRADELPPGRIICKLSRHLCAVIDGVIHDTHDPARDGTRCVYGYFTR